MKLTSILPRTPFWFSIAATLLSEVPGHAESRIPTPCLSLARSASLIDCYLNHPSNFDLAHQITWRFKTGLTWTTKDWKSWPDSAKSDLRQEYAAVVSWYQGGMGTYPIAQSPDPPVSLNASLLMHDVVGVSPLISAGDAWSIYKGHVALQLAAEMHSWIPWSIKDTNTMYWHSMIAPFMGAQDDGYAVWGATPAHASNVFRFLKQNGLIGSSKAETIGRVLDWSRYHLAHYFGGGTWTNRFNHWQHWGRPPISRIIEGTVNLDPEYSFLGKQHWIAGCSGSVDFLIAVLRTVNIYVQPRAQVGHRTAAFPSEGLALSHGDDPYTVTTWSNYPISLLLITEAQYQQWFPQGDQATIGKNVGRRPSELALQYPGSPWILSRYCDDLKNGRSHANSRVYTETFEYHYTLAEVEASGLWTKLPQLTSCPQR